MGIVVMLSGGVDSAALLAIRREAPISAAVFVDYGQPAVGYEQRAAVAVAEKCGVRLRLTRAPVVDIGGMRAPRGEPGPRVVPGRNLVLASFGVAHAVAVGATDVWFGCIREDRSDYPDCRPEFWAALSAASEAAYGVRVSVPLIALSKSATVELASNSGVFDLTWSCYSPAEYDKPCGTCNSCVSRTAAVARRHQLGMVP